MKAKLHAVHSIPGRIRFRIPERRRDRAFFGEIEKHLAGLKGVSKVETNPMTGSVLLHFDGAIDQLLAKALGSPLGTMVEFVPSSPPVARRMRAEVGAVDRAIHRFTNGELDLSTVSLVALLAMAGVRIVRGQQPVTSVSLLWYASELLRQWKERSHGATQGL
jgi:hypothetical protein